MKTTEITTILGLVMVALLPNVYATTAEIVMDMSAGNFDCDKTDTCFTPSNLMIKRGTDVVVKNNDSLPHTVTSGTVHSGPDGIFDSGLIISNSETIIPGNVLDKDGQYDYFCIVHPWMVGQIDIVKDFYDKPLISTPEWFTQVTQWHKEGKIPDNEYYWAVGYLDDNNLL